MAYVSGNPKTKAEIKRLLSSGRKLTIFQPGLGDVPLNGSIFVEGPHYPQPHKWYGVATIENGVITKIK